MSYFCTMLQRAGRIFLSFGLALLLLFGSTAKEFIHSFAGHHDTVHAHDPSGLSFESQHHHCDFLSFSFSAFNNDVSVPLIKRIISTYEQIHIAFEPSLIPRDALHTALRGPPVPDIA